MGKDGLRIEHVGNSGALWRPEDRAMINLICTISGRSQSEVIREFRKAIERLITPKGDIGGNL